MKPLNHEQRELAEDAADMADPIARRWQRLHPRYADEIQSSAMIGAIAAAESFQPDKNGAIWHRWVHLKVEGSIIDFLRASGRHISCTEQSQNELGEIEDYRAPEALDDTVERVASLLGRLPAHHKYLCNLVYREGMDPTAASKVLGFSQSYGCRLHREAIVLIRDMAMHE